MSQNECETVDDEGDPSGGADSGPEAHERAVNKGDSCAAADGPEAGTVSEADRSMRGSEPENAKQNAKRAKRDDAPEDLRKVIDAWPTLPEAVKAGIRAMVNAAGRSEADGEDTMGDTPSSADGNAEPSQGPDR